MQPGLPLRLSSDAVVAAAVGNRHAAVDMGGVAPMDYDTRPLLDAFPIDLWR